MASASKTPNLNLPQWVGTEKPERTDFNAAFDAIDGLVVSGSNSNGSYIKFPDGTMECFAELTAAYAQINRLEATWTFPQNFVGNNPILSVTREGSINVTPIDLRYIASGRVNGLTNATVRLLDPSGGWVAGNVRQVYVRAIGRWK